jgi:GH25 family lysozyme M1 (1,4-beta-N-acetylmuramidase)
VLEAPERITFAIFKATDGTRVVDAKAERNKRELLALGGAIVPGCYHVTHPKPAPGLSLEQDAEREAEHCAAWAEGLTLPPSVDFELNQLTPERQAVWLSVHLKRLENLIRRKPIVYTGAMMLPTLILCSPWLNQYPLWIAKYPQAYLRTNEAGVRIHGPALTFEKAESQKLPTVKPWANAAGWQFSGGAAGLPGNNVRGVAPVVDCNIFAADMWATLLR